MTVTLTKCKNCEKDFIPKRKTAQFCSTKCRVYNHRGIKPIETALYYSPTKTPEQFKEILKTKQPETEYCKHGFALDTRMCKKGCR